MEELITSESLKIRSALEKLDNIDLCMEDIIKNSHPIFKGERFLTDKEVSTKLKISRRTLQEYRNNLSLSYIPLGGKIIYRESDIEKMLKENHIKKLPIYKI